MDAYSPFVDKASYDAICNDRDERIARCEQLQAEIGKLKADNERLKAEVIAWKHSAANEDCLKEEIERLIVVLHKAGHEIPKPMRCR